MRPPATLRSRPSLIAVVFYDSIPDFIEALLFFPYEVSAARAIGQLTREPCTLSAFKMGHESPLSVHVTLFWKNSETILIRRSCR